MRIEVNSKFFIVPPLRINPGSFEVTADNLRKSLENSRGEARNRRKLQEKIIKLTAGNLAGSGKANSSSLFEAIDMAIELTATAA